ncbi:glycosyltransferase [Pseudomonas fluorescens]|uniref:glycosyltransferase n=1 Tax=Pseudomonas fluorescens TaxID=294 RepID=UPI0009BAB422|nr:glycosyltransferase [Pseudomonas fluorescens]
MDNLVSSLPIVSKDGGGWATRRVINFLRVEQGVVVHERSKALFGKIIYAVLGMVLLPFIHPIFTRFLPVSLFFCSGRTYLNFSQTFGALLFSKHSWAICHDLQCHRPFKLMAWVRWSEGVLLRRAERIVTLSNRDAKIVRRLYQVPFSKIISAQSAMLGDIKDFSVDLSRLDNRMGRVVFLGSILRRENFEALTWFVEQVLSHVPDLVVEVIGSAPELLRLNHPRIKYLGFVEDVHSYLRNSNLMIAPMLSPAGIKIKVIEALELGVPVLGTKNAYSGLSRPSIGYCSNDPSVWISTLSTPCDFCYRK